MDHIIVGRILRYLAAVVEGEESYMAQIFKAG